MNLIKTREIIERFARYLPKDFYHKARKARCIWLSEKQANASECKFDKDLWNALYVNDTGNGCTLRMPFESTLIYCEEGEMPAFAHWVVVSPGCVESALYAPPHDFIHYRRCVEIRLVDIAGSTRVSYVPDTYAINDTSMTSIVELLGASNMTAIEHDLSANMGFYARIAYWFAYPENAVLNVIPNKQGKSVTWREPREHYVIVAKEDREDVVRYANEGRSLPIEIFREAHPRKGHPRKLSSAKFSKKQGQTIWVKDAWVGPKEWEDKAQGVIYRVYEPED